MYVARDTLSLNTNIQKDGRIFDRLHVILFKKKNVYAKHAVLKIQQTIFWNIFLIIVFLPENSLWHLMQIIFLGDSLH